MPYDASLDQCLYKKALETEQGRLNVCIYSYNNGPKKLQIARENRGKEGDFKFSKLGRITKDEAESLIPAIQEALTKID
ncbi:MAG: hypothetical protein ABH843_00880 [Candidatus Omnitrophota bacterium]